MSVLYVMRADLSAWGQLSDKIMYL